SRNGNTGERGVATEVGDRREELHRIHQRVYVGERWCPERGAPRAADGDIGVQFPGETQLGIARATHVRVIVKAAGGVQPQRLDEGYGVLGTDHRDKQLYECRGDVPAGAGQVVPRELVGAITWRAGQWRPASHAFEPLGRWQRFLVVPFRRNHRAARAVLQILRVVLELSAQRGLHG